MSFAYKSVLVGYVLMLVVALYTLIMPDRYQPSEKAMSLIVGFSFGWFAGSLYLMIVN